MTLCRYTCTKCGLSTRCEQGADHRVCFCGVPYTEEPEDPVE